MNIEVRTRKEPGAPYVRHTLLLDGQQIHAQLGAYSDSDIQWRIHQHLNPPAPRTDFRHPKNKPGPKPGKKSPKVNERGFLWADE